MKNEIKYMLLGILLAVFSVGACVAATEEDIFIVVAVALSVISLITFFKGFAGKNEKDNEEDDDDTE
ncbi:MAG: hypothetical protein R3Y36_01595 [Spirochaetales bacterium]